MRSTGAHFEQRACEALQAAGLKLIERNFHTRYGEIDLVMRHGDTIVFVEVKYRVRPTQGDASASVTPTKQTKLIAAAQLWLMANPKLANAPCRFDVVAYDGPTNLAAMSWHRAAFDAG